MCSAFVVREEGGDYEPITWREFKRFLVEGGVCAVGAGGMLYDFIIAAEYPGISPWRSI